MCIYFAKNIEYKNWRVILNLARISKLITLGWWKIDDMLWNSTSIFLSHLDNIETFSKSTIYFELKLNFSSNLVRRYWKIHRIIMVSLFSHHSVNLEVFISMLCVKQNIPSLAEKNLSVSAQYQGWQCLRKLLLE